MFTDKKNDVNEQTKKRKEDTLAALNSLPPVTSGIPMPKVHLQPNKEQAIS